MIRLLRYLLSTAVLTCYHGFRILSAARRGVPSGPGSPYDDSQRRYGAGLLRANKMDLTVDGPAPGALTGPVVFVSNHNSWVDIWALLVALPGTIRFVYKKELAKVPILGPAIAAMGHVSIDRGNRGSAFSSYDHAARQIRGGTSAIVFAEGTRSMTGRLLPFKKGPFVLAIAAQVPVVPVVCLHTYERLPRRSIVPRPGPIVVRIGTPIPTAGLNYDARDDLAAAARAAMLELGAEE